MKTKACNVITKIWNIAQTKCNGTPIAATKALAEYIVNKDDEAYLIKSNKKDKFKDNKPLSRQRAWEVMKVASEFAGLNEIGCHTLRKTFGYHYYQQTKDIALLMYLFNHSKSEITLRYIGITDDMMDKAFDSIDY